MSEVHPVRGQMSLQPVMLHGESSKRLAPPRNTEDRKHLQSTQTTINRHNSQTKHYRKGSPGVKTHNTNHHSNRLCNVTLCAKHSSSFGLGDRCDATYDHVQQGNSAIHPASTFVKVLLTYDVPADCRSSDGLCHCAGLRYE